MKVSELLSKLKAFEPDLDVVCYCEDEGIGSPGVDYLGTATYFAHAGPGYRPVRATR